MHTTVHSADIENYVNYSVRIAILPTYGAFKRCSNGLVMNQGGQKVNNVPPNMFVKQQYTANIYIVAVECIEIIMVYSKILFFEKNHYKKVSEFQKKV